MKICELVKTKNDEGLTLTEMIAKRRMKVALKAFNKRKDTLKPDPIIEEINQTDKNFYNLYSS